MFMVLYPYHLFLSLTILYLVSASSGHTTIHGMEPPGATRHRRRIWEPETTVLTFTPALTARSRPRVLGTMAETDVGPETEQNVVVPGRRSRAQVRRDESATGLIEALNSADSANKAAIVTKLDNVFEPMAAASMNSATSVIDMSDDDGYSILSKCRIGSAVMSPFILDPQWKVGGL
jgi:hypothetical protein